MPPINVHSLSAAIAGFVIVVYWIVFAVTVIDNHSTYPSFSQSARPDWVEAGVCNFDGAVASTQGGACRSMATTGTTIPNS